MLKERWPIPGVKGIPHTWTLSGHLAELIINVLQIRWGIGGECLLLIKGLKPEMGNVFKLLFPTGENSLPTPAFVSGMLIQN